MQELSSKSKIICTIGPATNTFPLMKELILAGMNVARINFSHGERTEHGEVINMLRRAAKELNREIGIMVDLQGPKIRTNSFPNGAIELITGQEILVEHSEEDGNIGKITTKFLPLVRDLLVGDKILLDDGLLELKVKEKRSNALLCDVVYGGTLKNKKGINLPNTKLNVPALTEKDIADINYCLNLDIDFFALSFVREAQDVIDLRKIITDARKDINIISKIEKPEAMLNLSQIIQESDGIMVARGDLGVEMGNAYVPGVQKEIIKECLSQGVPVITATQMLESMITNPRPTRAEASDVANAIFDGTDAVMLSGETAVGKYPIETVIMMQKIVSDAEKHAKFFNFPDWRILDSSSSKMGMSIAKTANLLAKESNAKGIVCLSHTGNAAIRVTTQRPEIPVFMFSYSLQSVRKMCFIRGAIGVLLTGPLCSECIFMNMEKALLDLNYVQKGEYLVFTAGFPSLQHDTTNTVNIRKVL